MRLASLLLLIPISYCSSASTQHHGTHRSSSVPSTPPATVSLEEELLVIQMKRVIQSVNKFSNRLYNVMNEYKHDFDAYSEAPQLPSQDNLVYSPMTIFTALAMLREGAAGDTATEMGNILSLTKVNDTVLEKGLGLILESVQHRSDKGSLNVMTRLFLDHSYHPKESYVNGVKDKFQGELVQTHFSNASAATRFVNEHMYSASHGVLQDVLAETEEEMATEMTSVNGTEPIGTTGSSSVSIDGGLMLVSGLTMEGDWERSFTPLLTRKSKFWREDGSQVEVEMMHRDGAYYYAEIPELNASVVAIPYKGHRFSFNVILPEVGTSLEEVEQNLESFPFPAVLSRLSKQHVQLSLPRFQVETTVDLIEPLEQLGIRRVFREDSADFSRLAKEVAPGDIYLSNAVHKTFLDVSEGGSRVPSANFIEAVPATSRHLTPFTVNRPFVFFVSDQLLQTVVLAGRKAQ